MRLAVRLGGEELDVEVDARPGATVGDLVEALVGGPVDHGVGLVVDGRGIDAATPLALTGIRHGAEVGLGRAPAQAEPFGPPPVVELRVVGGLEAGARALLAPGRWVLGRGGDVVLDDATVSFRHARLEVGADGRCLLDDLGSRNGTRVDGCFVDGGRAVAPSQLIELGASQLRLLPVTGPGDHPGVPTPHAGPAAVTFNRPPRRAAPPAPGGVLAPTAAPEPVPGARPGWASLLAPLALGAVMAALFEPVFAVFALFGPVMLLAGWWEDRRRVKREKAAGRRRLEADLVRFRSGLRDAAALEAARRHVTLPDPAETLRRAELPAPTLWERRRHHDDALVLSLGTADVAWHPPVLGAPPWPPEVEEAVARAATLPRTALAVDLRPPGVLGVVGRRPAALALARSLVCQAAVHHGPADVRIAVLTDAARAADWDWAKWLPHTEGGRAAARDEADAVAASLLSAAPGALPFVVVDADGFTEGRHAPVRELLASGATGGLVVADAVERLPSICTTVVELEGPDGLGRVTEPAAGTVVPGVLVGGVGTEGARRCARSLAGLEDPEAGNVAAQLPAHVSLFGLADGGGPPTPAALRARWRSSASEHSLAAVVGVHEGGPFVVDLVADGPHALVAGTTGAGKSELLRTWVASLAAAHGPDRLNLVLVDYKGGSAFGPCAGLPHVVGLVTDLDERLGERALRSFEAELRHRETLMRRAGAGDLREYDGVRAASGGRHDTPPLPRLLVVVDEFATMAAELPDFVDSLVGIAQRGRSLGVHLILATQRPAGAVSDNIRANTNLRIALRVQDVADSVDVVGTPDAAALDRRRPGRGYVRRGHGEVQAFQAALVSSPSAPRGTAAVVVRPFCFSDAGGAGAVSSDGDGSDSDLSRLVEAAVAAAEGGPVPRRPWSAPLPAVVHLHDLPPGCLGLADEPDRQRQVPYRWEPAMGNLLVYGVAGSGTTTALATVALALATGGPRPPHLYVLDFGSGALAPLARLPGVGAVVGAGDRERQERLVRILRAELERRRSGGDGDGDPDVVLLVDNVGAFLTAFDDVAGMAVHDDVLRLLADGPSVGMVVVASADRPGAVPSSWSSLVPERLVLHLADPYDYTTFGLPPHHASAKVPGRARHTSSRREVQLALPAPGGIADLAAAVACAEVGPAPSLPPRAVGVLPDAVVTDDVLGSASCDGDEWFLPVGIGDTALLPVGLRLGEGDHALVAGPARSGKSTVLCVLAEAVARTRPEVAVTAVALRRSPLRLAPGLARLVTGPDGVAGAVAEVAQAAGPQVLLVDDADVVEDAGGALASLLALRRPGLHVVAAGRADALRSAYGHWVTEVRRSRQGVALRPHVDLDGDLWHTVLPRRGPAVFGPGRGYLVCEGITELVQVAVGGAAGEPAGAGRRP